MALQWLLFVRSFIIIAPPVAISFSKQFLPGKYYPSFFHPLFAQSLSLIVLAGKGIKGCQPQRITTSFFQVCETEVSCKYSQG
jgi:hypothetical protein